MRAMTEPNTIVVVDQQGTQHWASRQSAFVKDGLADGSLTEVDDAPVPAPGEDLDAGDTDSRSGDGEPDAGDTDSRDSDSVAGATRRRG
jgi:hypothetical protein